MTHVDIIGVIPVMERRYVTETGLDLNVPHIVFQGMTRRGGMIATEEMGQRFVTKRGMGLTVLQDVLPRMTPPGITPVTLLMEVDCVTIIGMDQIVQYSVSHRTVN